MAGEDDVTDSVTREQRSHNMSRIRASNTLPELIVRSALHRLGYRFRLHCATLPGKPDIVLSKHRTVIFVNGCFWHQHPGCHRATMPKSRQCYWRPKLEGNVRRLQLVARELSQAGWNVVVVWECETKSVSQLEDRLMAEIGPPTH